MALKTCSRGHTYEVDIYVWPLRKCPDCIREWRHTHSERIKELSVRWRQTHTEEQVWWKMLNRCTNPLSKDYHCYGGRGITVCKRWSGNDGRKNFLLDMGRRPSSAYSLERKNNNKGYSPSNCVWATRDVQVRNRRTNIFYEIAGIVMCEKDWSRELSMTPVAFKRDFVFYRV